MHLFEFSVSALWTLFTGVYLTRFFIPLSSQYVNYGKLQISTESIKPSLPTILQQQPTVWKIVNKVLFDYSVPESFHWRSMYVVAIILNLNYIRLLFSNNHSIPIISLLYLFQSIRRCYECFQVHVFSNKRIRLPLFIAGAAFYVLSCSSVFITECKHIDSQTGSLTLLNYVHLAIGIAFFGYCSFMQYRCHCILANLRKEKQSTAAVGEQEQTKKQLYKIPQGGWFDSLGILCPHYLAEIGIYISLGWMFWFGLNTFSFPLGATILFVVLNLVSSAHETKKWYLKQFPTDQAVRSKKALLPFI